MYSLNSPSRSAPSLAPSKSAIHQIHPRSQRRIPRPLLAQSEEDKAPQEEVPLEKPVKLEQSALKTYQIPAGRGVQTALWFLRAFLRGGCGSFVDGYTLTTIKDTDDSKYLPLKPFGYPNVVEVTDKIAQYRRPENPIEVYEYEACPFCRKVREAATILDLDIMFYPTPRQAPHHRSTVAQLGGKQSYPFMVDPNTNTSMYESDDIVAYLFKQYGDGTVPLPLKLGFLTAITCTLCSVVSAFRGFTYRQAKYPEKPLIFWGYELSPFSVFVREVLTELELPFLQIYCGRGSPKRQQMKDTLGVFQVPYLEDPNTGVTMFESDQIVQYLNETYAL